MGYESHFSARIIGAPERTQELAATLQQISGYGVYVVDGAACVSNAKWYHYEDDFRAASESFPGCVIEVERVGEEYPDIVRQRFRDGIPGVEVKAQIAFPELSDPEVV